MNDPIKTLKMLIREEAVPYFTDEELQFYLDRNNGDINGAAYDCLTVKAEDTTLAVSGMTLGDTSKYFRKLAQRYRPNHTGILRG